MKGDLNEIIHVFTAPSQFSEMPQNSTMRISKDVACVSPLVEPEMEPTNIFKSNMIIVDESKLKNRNLPSTGKKENAEKLSKEKLDGNIFSRALKRAQSFGKNKKKKSEAKNIQQSFTLPNRKKDSTKEETKN